MTRKPMVAGNWKMNKNLYETRDIIRELVAGLPNTDNVDVLICPPSINLGVAKRETEGSPVLLGAQNMHWEASGAFTGEISADMVAVLCTHIIIGHSERRAMFGETDETVNNKLFAALKAGLTPIVCVGETLEENQAGETKSVVGRMVREGLKGMDQDQAKGVIVAYEPVWAIGTGLAATPEGANAVHKDVIRPILREMFGDMVADGMRILYGGSVNAGNAAELFGQSDIDGGLIGGASLKPASFIDIIKAA